MKNDAHQNPTDNQTYYRPFRSILVTLQFTQDSSLPFFHQFQLGSLIKNLNVIGNDYIVQNIRIDALESGRTFYPKGSHYRFIIYLFGELNQAGNTIIDNLWLLSEKQQLNLPERTCFGHNLKCLALHDALTQKPINQLSQTKQYSRRQFEKEIHTLRQTNTLTITWLSRAVLEVQPPKHLKNNSKKRTYCRDSQLFTPTVFFKRLEICCARNTSAQNTPPKLTQQEPNTADLTFSNTNLFWLNDSSTKKQFSGMAGNFEIQGLDQLSDLAIESLVICQYLGIGSSTAFGLGRYTLYDTPEDALILRPMPMSLLFLAGKKSNLNKAWRHTVKHSDQQILFQDEDIIGDPIAPDNNEEPNDSSPVERMQNDIQRMLTQQYPTPKSHGILIPKTNGGWRSLAIAPIYDRSLQRAILQIITPGLEKIQHQHSYGYRPGRSRITAAQTIKSAWRSGYKWVYESDIEDFFNVVNWHSVKIKLQSLYGQDPIVTQLLAWIKAEIYYKGTRIERDKGLPQGAPVSPILANLILDDFDTDMQAAGFTMIRYADDFVVMCKDRHSTDLAKQAAEQSLAEHGLTLKPEKTAITSMDRGLRYLGYLFVNDLVLDVGSGQTLTPSANNPKQTQHPWVQALIEHEPAIIDTEHQLKQWINNINEKQTLNFGTLKKHGASVFITGDYSLISTNNKQLNVIQNDKLILNKPWSQITTLFLFGAHQITNQAMRQALRQKTTIHLASSAGYYQGVITSHAPTQGSQLWIKQLATAQDQEQCLYISRELIVSRVIHQRETLRQRNCLKHINDMAHTIQKISRSQNISELMGHEGYAAKQYFSELNSLIPEQWEFSGRNRRPPKDPYNVLLSLGYTTLYGYVYSLLQAHGLYPWEGFVHKSRGKHAALASDMIEPFRHYAERAALSAVQRKQLTLDNFTTTPAGSCLIDSPGRRIYLATLNKRWLLKSKAAGSDTALNGFEHLEAQTLSLKNFLQQGQPFKACRFR